MSNNAFKQEHFDIRTDGKARQKIVRQDRMDILASRAWVEWNEVKFEVVNISPFGIGFLVNKDQLTSVKNTPEQLVVPFYFRDIHIQSLHLKVARTEAHPTSVHEDWVIGCEIIGEPLTINRIKAIEQTLDVIEDQKKEIVDAKSVPAEFRALVLEMQHWLVDLKNKIDDLENKMPVGNYVEEQIYRNTVIEFIGDFIGNIVPNVYSEMGPIIEKMTAPVKEAATKFAREKIGPYVYGAPFAARAYFKPRGYAGDFEMMNHLYRNEGVGKSLFDQCMHRYFIDEPAGQAVKNRGSYLFSKIQSLTERFPDKKHFRILSIASGPAKEVQLFLENNKFPKDVTFEFNMLDQDEESLKHAQREILALERFVKSGFTFNFHNLAIKNIIGRGVPGGKYDLIYSAGLFDYFTEPVAAAAANKIFDALNSEGEAIIGNFSKDNPSSIFMELVLDWHLIYRSEDDLKRMFGGITKNIKVEKENLGINLFAILKNK